MKKLIIGLGTVGTAILEDLQEKDFAGIDINQKKVKDLYQKGLINEEGSFNRKYSHIVITVNSTNLVLNILGKLNYELNPLVCIESTIGPSAVEKIIDQFGKKCKLAVFPHRYFSKDRTKRVFNLKRVCGLYNCSQEHFFSLYGDNLPKENVLFTTPFFATLSKIVENAYRYLEISIAEELKLLCNKKNIDFEELRMLVNSKWNINMLEARDGIKGSCLNNDILTFIEFLEVRKISLFKTAIDIDNKYKGILERRTLTRSGNYR